MTLTGPQRKRLVVALQDAFPSHAALKRMVSFGLSENLDRIAGTGSLQDAAFELVGWAEAQGRLDDLVEAASSENPGNATLRTFVEDTWGIVASTATEASGSPRTGANRGVEPSSLEVQPPTPTTSSDSPKRLDGSAETTARARFFISYTQADRQWAEWIAWQLEEAGLSTVLQAWDFGPGSNFVLEMDRAAASADRTVAVLSPDYLTSRFAAPEWAAAFAQDPTGESRRLLPVRVRPLDRQGLLSQIVYVDLVGLDAEAARAKLLAAVAPGRAKPAAEPSFPGAGRTDRVGGREPAFPAAPPPVTTRRAIVLTALDVEYQAVQALLADLQEEVHPRGTVYERGRFAGHGRTWDVGLVQVGTGNERAAFEAERAMTYFSPEVALFVGVAGGLKDVALGDVVAATKVYGYEAGKAAAEFQPRPEVGQSSYALIQRAMAVARSKRWRERIVGHEPNESGPAAFVAPIAAGSKVVAATESETAQFLRHAYGDAVAVEMEGAGFLTAMHANQEVGALVVRGISDLIAGKAAADAAGWQARAAQHAAAFAFAVLATLNGPDLSQPSNYGQPSTPRPPPTEPKGEEARRVFHVPRRPSPHFTGRGNLLAGLKRALATRGGTAAVVQAIEGLGGVGKTELALKYAHDHRDDYDGVWWLEADIPTALAAGYTALGAALGLALDATAQETVIAAVREELEQITERWLLVFDNAGTPEELESFLPHSGRTHVIITSRQRVWRRLVPNPITVDLLPLTDAVRLLQRRSGRREPGAAEELAEALGRLPLALEQAAAYVAEKGSSLRSYLAGATTGGGRPPPPLRVPVAGGDPRTPPPRRGRTSAGVILAGCAGPAEPGRGRPRDRPPLFVA